MDPQELERDSQVKEFIRTHERQYAGLDRHFRGPDGFGWFVQDPDSIAPEMLQRARFPVKTVYDLSNVEASVEGKQHKLAPGSFGIKMDYGRSRAEGGIFTFSHPEDIEEFLQQAGVTQPEELIGREMIQYWIGNDKEIRGGDRTVGAALPEFSIPLSELIKRHQRK